MGMESPDNRHPADDSCRVKSCGQESVDAVFEVSRPDLTHPFRASGPSGRPCSGSVSATPKQLVLYAESRGIDHIIVGHRGHTLFERWLIGSVARQVIAYAHCGVTVVRG